MPAPIQKGPFLVCQKSGKIVGVSPQWRFVNWVYPLMGLVALVWFLCRVIPKPIRATYPCQRAAFPLVTSSVLWLLGVKTGLFAWIKWRELSQQFRPVWMVGFLACLCVGVAWAATQAVAGLFRTSSSTAPQAATAWTPSDPPNSPIGQGKGIFPGRVTWLRDTNATPYNGVTGYWWIEGTGVRLGAVERMMSRNLRGLTGANSDAEAWDNIFRYYNSTHQRGQVGYATNEAIAIKINLNNSTSITQSNNLADASQQMVLALLRQLVNKAGVPQNKIAVYEAAGTRRIPNRIYTLCSAEFPNVLWYDGVGDNGRQPIVWAANALTYSGTTSCGRNLPTFVTNATYLINMPILKGHELAGITLAAKNHYGSISARDHSAVLETFKAAMPAYSMFPDFLGSKHLGGKTILNIMDGLFENITNTEANDSAHCSCTNLFGGQWSASMFMSFDPVALDSVGLDFLRAEWGDKLGYSAKYKYGSITNCDNYIHEAALCNSGAASSSYSGTVYKPDGTNLTSLGVHEHWNNATAKQYSRNLGSGTGIELLALHDSAAIAITITSPTNNAVFAVTTNIPIATAITTSFASVSRVDFFRSGALIGSATNDPFSLTWTNLSAGAWALTAVATDADGYSVTSAPVNVTCVINGLSITLTNPVNGSVVAEGTNLTLMADVAAGSGINHVDFFAGVTPLGSVAAPPYTFSWTNIPAGTWPLTAAVTDNSGQTLTSAVVNLTVARTINVTLTAPAAGLTLVEGTDLTLAATAGCPFSAISKVEFFANGALLGSDFAPAPFNFTWSNVPAGPWALTAVATDTSGFTGTSAVVTVTSHPAGIATNGTLYIDLRAQDTRGGTAVWPNRGLLAGNFARVGAPAFVTNVLGTGISGVQFNGTTDAFIGPNSIADIDGAGSRSFEAWVYNPAIATEETMLEIGHRGTTARNCAFNYGSHLAYGACAQWGAYDIGWYAASNIPPAATWHHLVYTYDGGTACKIYVDGALRISTNVPAALNTFAGEPILLGAQRGTTANSAPSGYWFSGYLNSVRVHGGCLTSNDVLQNFTAGPFIGTGPVTITVQPRSRTVTEHSAVTFSASAAGLGPIFWQWYRNNETITNATSASYALPDTGYADHGAVFLAIASNRFNSVVTSNATLNVIAPGIALTHRYSFTSNASDSVGTAHGTLFGAATITNGQLTLTGANGTYTSLPGSQIAVRNYEAVTFEAWATFGANANWPRLFDQGSVNGANGQYDLYFCPRSGNNDYRLTIMDPNPTERRATAPGNLDNRTNLHIVCVLDPPTGFMGVYTNGVLAATASGLTALTSVDTNLFYLGRSLFAADAWLNGSIDEFRIYNLALSPALIASNFAAGPGAFITAGPVQITADLSNQTALELETVNLSATVRGDPPMTYQWYRDGSIIIGATNSTYAFTMPRLAGSASQFYCVISNAYGAVTTRVATVTTQANPNFPLIISCPLSNDSLFITFRTAVGRTYHVEYSDTLAPGSWSNISPPQAATGTSMTITNIITDRPRRFYRAVLDD